MCRVPLLRDAPRFLTYEELCEEIQRYRYRPGWDLSVFLDPWESSCLYIRADVIDGYHPDRTTELRIRSHIPPIPSADYFAVWLQWRLLQVESHESREYLHLRATDRPVYDPHQPWEPGGKELTDDLTDLV